MPKRQDPIPEGQLMKADDRRAAPVLPGQAGLLAVNVMAVASRLEYQNRAVAAKSELRRRPSLIR